MIEPVNSGFARHLCAWLVLAPVCCAEVQPSADAAGNGSLKGRVTKGGRPAAYANVIAVGTRVGTMTREDGSFDLPSMPVGAHTIQIMAFGCEKVAIPVTVNAGSIDSIAVDLPCPLTRCFREEHVVPECFRANPAERARVASKCRIHSTVALRPDTVRIGYGLQIVEPDFVAMERDSFPNARDWWGGGCVVEEWAFTEVAYCGECRRSQERWLDRRRGRR